MKMWKNLSFCRLPQILDICCPPNFGPEVTHQSAQTQLSVFLPFAPVVPQGGEGESGGRLSHGCSGGLPPRSLLPDEDLLGAGATQEAHLPQTEGETGAGDELALPRGPWVGPGLDLGEHTQQTVELDWIVPWTF